MKSRELDVRGLAVKTLILVAILGFFAALAIPTLVREHMLPQKDACINNLRLINGAKRQWAKETKQATNATPSLSDLIPYLKNEVSCPSSRDASVTFNSSYTVGDLFGKPTCKILPATHVLPPETSNDPPYRQFGFGIGGLFLVLYLILPIVSPRETATRAKPAN